MKREKGFTLIELLAVIVIIAVIALISTPLVLNYIDESKAKSIENSLISIERAALTHFTNNNVKNTTIVDLSTDLIEIENNNFEKGYVIGNRDNVKIYIYKDGYCGVKNNSEITVKEIDVNECDFKVDDSVEIATTNKIEKSKTISGYRIYGNTVNNVSLGESSNTITLKLSGKNSFNVKISELYSSTSNIETYNNGYRLTTKNGQSSNQMSTAVAYRFDLENGVYTICAETKFEGQSIKKDGSTPADIRPIISVFHANSVAGNKYQYSSTKTLSDHYFTYLNFEVTDENKVGYLRVLFNDLATVQTYNTQGIIWNIQILPGTITTLEEAGNYEPYITPQEYTITLSEPLRKIEGAVDYIDSNINQVVRNVGVNADGSLYVLEKPVYEYIELPSITNLDGTTIVSANDGSIDASSLEVLIKK